MRNRYGLARVVVTLLAPWVVLCAFGTSTAFAHPLSQRPTPPVTHAGLDEAATDRSAPEGRRDPFQSWLEPSDRGGPGPMLVCPDTRQPTPLERFDLSVRRLAPSIFCLARGTQLAGGAQGLRGGSAGHKRAFGNPIHRFTPMRMSKSLGIDGTVYLKDQWKEGMSRKRGPAGSRAWKKPGIRP